MSLENVYKRLYLAKLNVPMDLIRKIADELECDHLNSLVWKEEERRAEDSQRNTVTITCYKCRGNWDVYQPGINLLFNRQSDEVTAAANRELKSRKDAERAAETAKAEEAARLEKESKTPQQLIEDLEEKKKIILSFIKEYPAYGLRDRKIMFAKKMLYYKQK